MALVVGVFGIVFSIIYILFQIGSDDGTTQDGCMMVVVLAVAFLALVSPLLLYSYSMDNGGNFAVASTLILAYYVGIVVLIVIKKKKREKKERDLEARLIIRNQELKEIEEIEKNLPDPTVQQMNDFFDDLESSLSFGATQLRCVKALETRERAAVAYYVDKKDFKELQSDWIYYTEHPDSESRWAEVIFPKQDLRQKTYFDPRITRHDELTYMRNKETFFEYTAHLPRKLAVEWLFFSQFSKKVFDMIESGEKITAENIYPIMQSQKSIFNRVHISTFQMKEDLLYYEVNHKRNSGGFK